MSSTKRRSTKARRRWDEIDARIQFYDGVMLRAFFAAAAKFLIDERHWDDDHPVTPFDKSPIVQSFHQGFEQFSAVEMTARIKGGPNAANELLGYVFIASNRGANRLRIETAKKRLTALRKRMTKRLRQFAPQDPVRGLHFYQGTLRRTYLRKPAAAPPAE
jgi:hypothetical protein